MKGAVHVCALDAYMFRGEKKGAARGSRAQELSINRPGRTLGHPGFKAGVPNSRPEDLVARLIDSSSLRLPMNPDQLLALASILAGRAAAVLLDGLTRPRAHIETKTSREDVVTEIDKASE